MAVFLVTATLIAGSRYLPQTRTVKVRGILEGSAAPVSSLVGVAQGAEIANSVVLTQIPIVAIGESAIQGAEPVVSPATYADGTIQDPGQPIGPPTATSTAGTTATVKYTIKKGDSLSSIASRFGVSVGALTGANPSLRTKALQIGSSIIVPGTGSASAAPSPASALPNFNRDFIIPTQGYDYGILHNYNAVDIANSCGTPVVAAADGLVIPDSGIPDILGGWNDGYGNFILIEHSFGNAVRTRYAHLEQILVQVGDYVKQGQEIGLMGETGDATGCHVHFEVIGAQNPFAK